MRTMLVFTLMSLVAIQLQAEQNDADLRPELQNKGFEAPSIVAGATVTEPDYWFYFSSSDAIQPGLTSWKKRNGDQALYLNAPNTTNAYLGYAQRFIAQPNQRYTLKVRVMSSNTDPLVGAAYGQISLEFRNAAGTELQRIHGPTWSDNLSADKWEEFVVEANAPEQSAVGVAVITLFSQDSKGQGTFFVDDVDLSSQPAL